LVITFLRGRVQDFSILDQQSYILEYAKSMGLTIDSSELDNSSYNSPLEEREIFLSFLKSLKAGDVVLTYSIYSLSKKIGEIVKIFDCIFKHKITLHLCYDNIIIDKNTPASFIVDLLSKTRETNMNRQNSVGRPKGSFSKSKFDKYRSQIVSMLSKGYSVNSIAKELSISRSSLKDYINSRSLKDVARLEYLPTKKLEETYINRYEKDKKCPLTHT